MGDDGDDGGTFFRDLRNWGVTEAEIEELKREQQKNDGPRHIVVEPENRDATRMFLRATSQWRTEPVVFGRTLLLVRTGLDYGALPVIAKALGLSFDQPLLDAVQAMEAEALRIYRARQKDALRGS